MNRITLDRGQSVIFGFRRNHKNTAVHADDITTAPVLPLAALPCAK